MQNDETTLMLEIRHAARRYLDQWCVEDTSSGIDIEWSPRMRRSLGRSYIDRRLIRLNPLLALPGNREILWETIAHELAHIVADDIHGRGIRPHGPEWRALLHRIGMSPRVTLPWAEVQHDMERREPSD